MGIKLPIGIESFSEIRTDGYYYADKTQLIKQLLDASYKVNLITRPRRFGKTLAMSMLADFLIFAKIAKIFLKAYLFPKKKSYIMQTEISGPYYL